jgi:hypothetical protein
MRNSVSYAQRAGPDPDHSPTDLSGADWAREEYRGSRRQPGQQSDRERQRGSERPARSRKVTKVVTTRSSLHPIVNRSCADFWALTD